MSQKFQEGRIAIILLAAGSSSRMGQSKQLLLVNGKSLLIHVAEIAKKSDVGSVIVVLGAAEETHRKVLNNLSVDVIYNSRWQTGMGSSLKAGLNHVIATEPKTEAVIVMVCDQPLLTTNHINSLIRKYNKSNKLLVASSYSNTVGVPALFGRQLFAEILKLGDEEGAKKIIQNYAAEVVEFPEGSIDLDTPDDYRIFLQQHPKKIS
jgi:molybdenum cofactor cytidylyltransferase